MIALREVLDKTESLRDYQAIQATVISRTPDRWFEKIVIDKGKKSGVEPDMAVITAKGLIGKVISTSEMTSTIELLSSDNTKNRVSAEIQGEDNKSIYGLIDGYDKEKKMLLMKDLPIDREIKPGQNVITSGYSIFPKRLDIGKVTSLEVDQYGLTQIAYVKPSADFYGFEHVMVVVTSTDKYRRNARGGGMMKRIVLPLLLALTFYGESLFADFFPPEIMAFGGERLFVPHFILVILVIMGIYYFRNHALIYAAILGLLFDVYYTEIDWCLFIFISNYCLYCIENIKISTSEFFCSGDNHFAKCCYC